MKTQTSISHFTGEEQQALLRLKNKIVAMYQPLIIYLIGCNISHELKRNCFGQRRNDHQWLFSCDLLLILPDCVSLPENTADELKSISNDYEQIRLIAHSMDFVEKQLQEYSLFFCWMQRKAIVLYDKDKAVGKLPEPVQNMKQYEQQAQQFLVNNPNYENYLATKLSPLPAKLLPKTDKNLVKREKSVEAFESYLKDHGAKSVNRNIRTVLLDYIRTSQSGYPVHFKEMLWDFTSLMEIFDIAEDEIRSKL